MPQSVQLENNIKHWEGKKQNATIYCSLTYTQLSTQRKRLPPKETFYMGLSCIKGGVTFHFQDVSFLARSLEAEVPFGF